MADCAIESLTFYKTIFTQLETHELFLSIYAVKALDLLFMASIPESWELGHFMSCRFAYVGEFISRECVFFCLVLYFCCVRLCRGVFVL